LWWTTRNLHDQILFIGLQNFFFQKTTRLPIIKELTRRTFHDSRSGQRDAGRKF